MGSVKFPVFHPFDVRDSKCFPLISCSSAGDAEGAGGEMAGNQPTITGVWGLGQHGDTAHFEINYAIRTVLFFSPAFWATGSAGKRRSRSIPVESRLWQEEEEGGCVWEQALGARGVLPIFLGKLL